MPVRPRTSVGTGPRMRTVVSISIVLGVCRIADAVEPRAGWGDSVSDGDQCYCDTTYDHDIGGVEVETPAGPRTVRQVCERIGPAPDKDGLPVYNDVQCGNGPANNFGDEDPDVCPGRVDLGAEGCDVIGPTWRLERHFSGEPEPEPEPEPGAMVVVVVEPAFVAGPPVAVASRRFAAPVPAAPATISAAAPAGHRARWRSPACTATG